MLVLSRRVGERIVIGSGPDAVVVEVLEIRPGQVRLGFHAPPEVEIMREELLDRESRPQAPRPESQT